MVTVEELHRQIKRASWFTKLGTFAGPQLFLPIADLGRPEVEDLRWFPCNPADPDPLHGDALEQLALDRGLTPDVRMATLTTVKKTRISLRSMAPAPLLTHDGEDLTERAQESALYAVRRATVELVLARAGFWTGLIPLYRVGHWPLGRLPDGRLAVY